jgi:hypothetical protein
MSKEKHPDPSGWKERLQEPGALPEWGMTDKEAAWDRLHARLGKPGPRIGAPWFRIAAAALLLMMGVTAALHKQRPATGLAAAGTATTAARPAAIDTPSSARVELIRESPAPALRKTPGRRFRHTASVPAPRQPIPIRIETPGPISIQPPSLIFHHPSENSGSGLAGLMTIPGKAMKVVHINELDHPTGRTSSMAGSRPTGSSWFRFRKLNDLDRSSSYPQQEEGVGPVTNTVLTIHLSPQN